MNNSTNFHMAYMDTRGPQNMLLIHGFPLNNGMWAPQYDDLYDLARIIGPDLAGHGSSDPPNGFISIAMMAQQCADLLDNLGITEPVIVNGMSMGGYIAFEFVKQFPERVKALILTSTRALPDSEDAKSGRNAAISKIKKKGMETFNQEMLPKLLSDFSKENNEDLVSFVLDVMNMTSSEGAINALNAMKNREDSTPLLEKIRVPTLIIHGEDDLIIPIDEAVEMQKQIDGSSLYILENAAHMPNLEQPDVYNGLVAEFLADLMEEA